MIKNKYTFYFRVFSKISWSYCLKIVSRFNYYIFFYSVTKPNIFLLWFQCLVSGKWFIYCRCFHKNSLHMLFCVCCWCVRTRCRFFRYFSDVHISPDLMFSCSLGCRGAWVCVYLVPPIRWPQTSAVSHSWTGPCSWSSGSLETLPATVFGTMSCSECAMCSATRSDLETEIWHSIRHRGNKSSETQRPRARNNSITQNRSLCSVSSSLDAHQTIKTHGRFSNHALVFLYYWLIRQHFNNTFTCSWFMMSVTGHIHYMHVNKCLYKHCFILLFKSFYLIQIIHLDCISCYIVSLFKRIIQ